MPTDVLRAIAGIGVYPVVSLLVFVLVFAAVIVRAARLDRSRADAWARLPLDEPTAKEFNREAR